MRKTLRNDRLRKCINLTLVLFFVLTFIYHSGSSLKGEPLDPNGSFYRSNKYTSNQEFTTTLNYNEYFIIHTDGWEGNEGNIYSWAFSGSNSYVGITVRVMDSSNYLKFVRRLSYTYHTFSNGDYYRDSGEWIIPYTSTWYTVFFNWDSDAQSTDLTITVSMTPPSTTPPPSTSTFTFRTTLSYRQYYTIWTEGGEGNAGNHMSWSFTGTNSYVGIMVQFMTADEYWKFKNGDSYNYYLLSDGSYYGDFGEFTIPYTDTWHFVFLNLDPDRQSTTITITIELNPATTTSLINLPDLATVSGPLNAIQADWADVITTATTVSVYRRPTTTTTTKTTPRTTTSTPQPIMPTTTTTKTTPRTTTSTPRTTTTTQSVVPELDILSGIGGVFLLFLWNRFRHHKSN